MTVRMNAAEFRATASEDEFLGAVVDLARLRGWLVYHPRPARTSKGWRTAGQGDAAGFPDLILAKGGRLVAVELKTERGRLTDAQRRWLEAAGGHVWRPSDWPRIVQLLTESTHAKVALHDPGTQPRRNP